MSGSTIKCAFEVSSDDPRAHHLAAVPLKIRIVRGWAEWAVRVMGFVLFLCVGCLVSAGNSCLAGSSVRGHR
jgi:hypothetical protein